MSTWRFDIVVINYNRVESFFNNFNKISNFNNELDIITVLSASYSEAEKLRVEQIGAEKNLNVRYIPRENKGFDQYPRIQYFLGEFGNEYLNSQYIFQMQEHYLDTVSSFSKWGAEYDYRVKGDVVPDNIIFDLNEIEELFTKSGIKTLFCDRNDPSYFEVKGRKYISPNGGNFIFDTSLLADPKTIEKLRYLKRTYQDKYRWAVFAEFFWGEIFFNEGQKHYDYKRKRIFTTFQLDEFHTTDNYSLLRKTFTFHPYKYVVKSKNSIMTLKLWLRSFLIKQGLYKAK